MRTSRHRDYRDLLARSQDDPEWFWDEVVDDLGIEFSTPYEKVLDDSRGPQWPRWFVGGEVEPHATTASIATSPTTP